MASVWITPRLTAAEAKRYRVEFRVEGRYSKIRYGGSFKTQREAIERKRYIAAELAGRRVPDLRPREAEAECVPTLAEAEGSWRESRIDVEAQTQAMHRSDFRRIFKVAPQLQRVRVDALTVHDLNALVAALHAHPYKRETIKKSVGVLAQLLDHYEVDPNPARDKRVKLPRERKAHIPPPLAEHVERVAEHLPRHHVLPFLVIDECGPSVSELETAQVGDLDEHRRAIRIRWTVEKNDRYRTWTCPTTCSPRSCRRSPHAKIVTWRLRSFPGWTRPRSAPRSHAPARPLGRRTSRLMACAVAEGRSTTSALARSPTWPSCWATPSESPPSTTSTR
jgi:integrase